MIEVNPTSQRWKEICEIEDEQTQSRAIKRYQLIINHLIILLILNISRITMKINFQWRINKHN